MLILFLCCYGVRPPKDPLKQNEKSQQGVSSIAKLSYRKKNVALPYSITLQLCPYTYLKICSIINKVVKVCIYNVLCMTTFLVQEQNLVGYNTISLPAIVLEIGNYSIAFNALFLQFFSSTGQYQSVHDGTFLSHVNFLST